MTRTITLTDAQYAVLKAFIDECAGFDSAQGAMVDAAELALGIVERQNPTEEQLDEDADAVIALQNGMFDAIQNATETPE